jgi:hypothetical protein
MILRETSDQIDGIVMLFARAASTLARNLPPLLSKNDPGRLN